jgi:hypothetical protein
VLNECLENLSLLRWIAVTLSEQSIDQELLHHKHWLFQPLLRVSDIQCVPIREFYLIQHQLLSYLLHPVMDDWYQHIRPLIHLFQPKHIYRQK